MKFKSKTKEIVISIPATAVVSLVSKGTVHAVAARVGMGVSGTNREFHALVYHREMTHET